MTFLTITNSAYLDFAHFTLSRWAMGKLLVQCIDIESYDALSKYESEDVKLLPPQKEKDKHHTFGSATFNQLCHDKWRMIIKNLHSFGRLYYFDIDVIFLKDIRDKASNMLDKYDIVFQHDSPLVHWPEDGGNYVCAGNFCMNNNTSTLKLLNEVAAKLNDKQNDQETLFYHLETFGKKIWDYPNAKIGHFNRREWQNGFDAFRAEPPQYHVADVVHINHMTGMDVKKQKLELLSYL